MTNPTEKEPNIHRGNFHIERDYEYEPEQCPVTKIWRRTKQVAKKTWSLYERVGVPAYQTWRRKFPNFAEAKKHIESLPA